MPDNVIQPEDDEADESWNILEDDPTDPSHPDYDLSSAAPAYLDKIDKPWFLQRWFVGLVALLLIAGLVLPYFLRL